MPDVSSGVKCSCCAVGCGYSDFFEDTLSCCDLVGTHDEEHFFGGEYAVSGEDGEQGVFFAEGLCEVDEVCYGAVFGVCPVAGEFEAVGGFSGAFFCAGEGFFYVVVAGGV